MPLAGRYRLISVVGRGGMGTVWRAHDETLDRDVAVKEVRLPSRLSEERRRALCQRVIGEARATAALNHPGVLTVFDVVVEGGRPWIVVELLKARSLQDVLDQDGPLPPIRAAEIGRKVLSVLEAAHAVEIVHRDVKPSNVLLVEDGRIVLTDFGLAVRTPVPCSKTSGGERHPPEPTAVSDPTSFGMVEGSPGYASPEQARGEPITPASDLWSLGATLFAAVEGCSPYARGHALASLLAVLLDEYRPPVRAGGLRPVIDGLLREDPAARLSAGRVATLLDGLADPVPPAPRPPRSLRRPRIETVVSVATLAAVVIALGAWSARWNSIGSSDTGSLLPRSAITAYHGSEGYSVRVPAGWQQVTKADGVYWYDRSAGRYLRISRAPGDAATELRRAEKQVITAGSYPGYRRLRLESVPQIRAVEWEFTWRRSHGLRSRIGGYELFFVAPDNRWTPSQRLYDAVLQTFRPDR